MAWLTNSDAASVIAGQYSNANFFVFPIDNPEKEPRVLAPDGERKPEVHICASRLSATDHSLALCAPIHIRDLREGQTVDAVVVGLGSGGAGEASRRNYNAVVHAGAP